MPTLRFEIVVDAPIERVWSAFQDIIGLLPALTPPEQKLVIESAEPLPPRVGTVVKMSAKGPFGRVKWTARYSDWQPPHATVSGVEARFVDEQVSGPFERWTQAHEFEAATDRTRCIDVIEYAVPFGVIGRVGDVLFLRRTIRKLFAARHAKMAAMFGLVPSPGMAGRGSG